MSVLPAVLGQVIFIINNILLLHKARMTNAEDKESKCGYMS